MDDTAAETTRRQFLELATLVATGVVIAAGTETAEATPPKGDMTRTPLAQGRLQEPITVSTEGPTDFHIHQVVVQPGADSGWHTHPGTALDIVKSGTVTAYLDECRPLTVEAGQAFFVPAGVPHLAANEGSEPAEIYVTYLVTAGAEPRADAAQPQSCR
jgi:quercetin dioxygenase-like cupin family protein